jgi:hypothetical protein
MNRKSIAERERRRSEMVSEKEERIKRERWGRKRMGNDK